MDARHTLIRKYDVEAINLLTAAFNEAISKSSDFEAALEKMVFSQRVAIPELKQEDFHFLLKSYNAVFMSRGALRGRVIDLIHHILLVDINPTLEGNDCNLLRAVIDKKILPIEDWAV